MAEALHWVQSAGASHPLEALHFRLLSAMLDHADGQETDERQIEDLLADYAALGITWPSAWLPEVMRSGSIQPIPF
jgi:hypothetical protein